MLTKVFGTRSVSTTGCHTCGLSAGQPLRGLLGVFVREVPANVVHGLAHSVLALKSASWRRMYAAETPARLADSGWPSPEARWQDAHPSMSPPAPCATTFGIGACSSGNQSGGLAISSICSCVYAWYFPEHEPARSFHRGGLNFVTHGEGPRNVREIPWLRDCAPVRSRG